MKKFEKIQIQLFPMFNQIILCSYPIQFIDYINYFFYDIHKTVNNKCKSSNILEMKCTRNQRFGLFLFFYVSIYFSHLADNCHWQLSQINSNIFHWCFYFILFLIYGVNVIDRCENQTFVKMFAKILCVFVAMVCGKLIRATKKKQIVSTNDHSI